MELNIDTYNLKVLENFFKDLSLVNQRKVFLAAFKKAAKPLIMAVKIGVPVGKTGVLRRSVGAIAIPREIAIIVGTRLGGRIKGWYGHFMENGTMERWRKSGASTGRIIAKPFFEPAFDRTEQQMYNSIEGHWHKEIDRLITRVNKKKK